MCDQYDRYMAFLCNPHDIFHIFGGTGIGEKQDHVFFGKARDRHILRIMDIGEDVIDQFPVGTGKRVILFRNQFQNSSRQILFPSRIKIE